MKSKNLTIAVFVAIALLFSFGVAVEKASADSIMFPWVVKSPDVFTLISVVNTSGNTTCNTFLHYELWYKSNAGATPDEVRLRSCTSSSFHNPSSQDDLVSFDGSGRLGTPAGAALWNDPTVYSDTPNFFNSLALPSSARGFLLVDNNNSCSSGADEASLYGEVLVIQTSSGGAWGYVGYNAKGGGPFGPAGEPLSFNDTLDLQGEVLRSPRYFDNADDTEEFEATPVVLLPISTFTTKFFVTPVDYRLWEYGAGGGQRQGNLKSRIQFCTYPTPLDGTFPISTPCGLGGLVTGEGCQGDGAAVCEDGGIWNNNEGPMNSDLHPDVVCTAAININEENVLLNAAQIAYLTGAAPAGGRSAWTYVRSMVGSGQDALGRAGNTLADSIVGKLEYTDAAFSIGGVAVPSAVNDFKWIRNSSSLPNGDFDIDTGINTIGFGD